MKRLSELLSDVQIRRQVRSWTVLAAFFLIPLLYAIIANEFIAKIQNALAMGLEVTGFALLGIILGTVVILDFKQKAVDDQRDNDKQIDKSFTDLYEARLNIKQENIPKSMEYINAKNEKAQESANISLTQRTITTLKNNLVLAQLNNKSNKIEHLENKISNLQENDMYDKSFRALKYKDVLYNNSGFSRKEQTYRERHIDNPTKTNWWLKLITSPIAFLTLGGSLVSTFAFGISWEALIVYYLSIIVTTAIFSLIAYIIVTNRVINRTYKANNNMIEYISNMITYVETQNDLDEIEELDTAIPFDELDKDYSAGEAMAYAKGNHALGGYIKDKEE